MPLSAVLDSLIRQPALLPEEDENAFVGFYERVRLGVNPRDIFEELWVRDFVEYTWEIIRVRRWKDALVQSNLPRELGRLLANVITDPTARERLVVGWMRGETAARKRVAEILSLQGLDAESVTARAFFANLDEYESADRLLSAAEKRRSAALNQIDSRREFRVRLAEASRFEVQRVIDEDEAAAAARV